MRKPGTDPDNVRMSDVLCDFCRREWTLDVSVIEGHQGSVICGRCLAVAYSEVLLGGSEPGLTPSASPDDRCTMCLEHREDRAWTSPMHPEAVICERCINLAADALEKDAETDWRRPT